MSDSRLCAKVAQSVMYLLSDEKHNFSTKIHDLRHRKEHIDDDSNFIRHHAANCLASSLDLCTKPSYERYSCEVSTI